MSLILSAADLDLNEDPDPDPDFMQSAPELQFPPPAKIQHTKTRSVESIDDDSIKYAYWVFLLITYMQLVNFHFSGENFIIEEFTVLSNNQISEMVCYLH